MSENQNKIDNVLSSLSFEVDDQRLQSLKGQLILIKAGGNALTDEETKHEIVSQISILNQLGAKVVVVHGGGIEIKQLLDDVGVVSEFVGGHRKTDAKAMGYVEMALSGMVNKELVGILNASNVRAVGISGRDASMVRAKKRFHIVETDGSEEKHDLGFVGDVDEIDTKLIKTLVDADYIPVLSPVSSGKNGKSYNINADMFAGHMAGALKAEKFVALTNIDGLLENIDDPDSIISKLTSDQARDLFGSVIQGGMIPKIEACLIAIEKGVKSSHIINGTKTELLLRILLTDDKLGTEIKN
ncbi:acetylglutamate kinase [Rhodohalobacter sulfatireducens]|uniref:Acetylglutamate kinase n=1 Tax=Rhodohalobacter sulfatireducens TaxID=2911366 RepID=A0ABS9KIA6_9BACT|nr:acetylglutamate kinase [Rhodohalobacter sulfatireducens]MCG2590582.1 acetylglutamate kinase [Rhodohalobacter sulfatireducens]